MADTKKPSEPQSGKKPGELHYNPGNMVGKRAGIIKEHDEQKSQEKVERDGGPAEDMVVRRCQAQNGS